jgi:hypothetical protein
MVDIFFGNYESSNLKGLMGKDEFEKAKVNEIIDFHKDVYNTMSQLRKGDLVNTKP